MRKVISNIILIVSSLFILFGIGTLLTGDVNGTNEVIFMAIYLVFFVTIFAMTLYFRVEEKGMDQTIS